eukprot:COSAG01_NODE_10288_length_2200_cov_1.268920_1_plen_570_part_00
MPLPLSTPLLRTRAVSNAHTIGGNWLAIQLVIYGFSDAGKRCPSCLAYALLALQAVLVVGFAVIGLADVVSRDEDIITSGGTTIQIHTAQNSGVDGLEQTEYTVVTLTDPAFGDSLGHITPTPDCCHGATDEDAALAAHHPALCIAPECIPFFGTNSEWAAELRLRTARQRNWTTATTLEAKQRVINWQCGGSWATTLGAFEHIYPYEKHDAAWNSFAHESCDVQLAIIGDADNSTDAITVPRLCTPVYYCHKLREDDAEGIPFIHGFFLDGFMCGVVMLGILDRCLVLRVARSFALRIGTAMEQIEGQQGEGTSESPGLIMDMTATDLVKMRIGRTSRALLLWLWLPPLVFLVVLSWAQPTAFAAFYIVFWPMLVETLPAFSLGATALLLWAEAAVLVERADAAVRAAMAMPPDERDVNMLVETFVKLARAVAKTSQVWSRVLLVQLLLFGCSLGMAITNILIGSSTGQSYNIQIAPAYLSIVMWPLLCSFAAVVRLNSAFDAIPSRVTAESLFSCVERAAFADDYHRLRMRLKVLGVELTTQRLGGLLASAIGTTLFAVLRASLQSH